MDLLSSHRRHRRSKDAAFFKHRGHAIQHLATLGFESAGLVMVLSSVAAGGTAVNVGVPVGMLTIFLGTLTGLHLFYVRMRLFLDLWARFRILHPRTTWEALQCVFAHRSHRVLVAVLIAGTPLAAGVAAVIRT